MVLGTILYEGIDLSYHVLKLGYNGASSVYGYFWGRKTEMTPEEMQKNIEETLLNLWEWTFTGGWSSSNISYNPSQQQKNSDSNGRNSCISRQHACIMHVIRAFEAI